MVLCIAVLVTAAAATAPFDVVWNSPWPSACPDPAPAAAISRFGVRVNQGAAFNGDVVATLYNHAGACTVGDWPAIYPNGTISGNGGIPQNGSLPVHLAKVRTDIATLFPDPDHTGFIVIDWEEWEPYMNPRSKSVYMNASLRFADGRVDTAVAQWNASALDWMVQTLRTARAVRPHAKIGYYGMVGCYGQWDIPAGTCAGAERARNDGLAPLWAASSALFPSIYSACQYAGTPDPSCLPDASQGNATEAEKIPITLREAARVNTLHVPIVAYTWYTLYTHECAKAPPVGLGHCPLMRSRADLAAEFALAKEVGIDGIIVWGSNGDVRSDTTDCDVFTSYLNATLGPVLQGLTAVPETGSKARTGAASPGWNPTNMDCVSGRHLLDRGVWIAGVLGVDFDFDRFRSVVDRNLTSRMPTRFLFFLFLCGFARHVVMPICVSFLPCAGRVPAAGHTDSYAACQDMCAGNATCNACDWAGDVDLHGGSCDAKRTCYFRSDAFFSPHFNGICNHTSGHKPGAPGPAPTPPGPGPPPPAACGGQPAVSCHSDADCDTGVVPAGCSWCRSPLPGKLNVQTCGGPPSPGDCGNLPGAARNASATQYACFGDSVSKGIFGKLSRLLTAAPYGWEAFHPASNDGGGCGNTVRGRDCTDYWLEGQNKSLGRRWDVITYNYGLHDLANDSEFVTVAVYASNLRNITERLLADHPGTRQLFWLSSTPVPDVLLSPPRYQADVPKYNAAALAVLQEEPFASAVTVVDVYAFVVENCGGDPNYKSCAPFQDAAGVHFSSKGYEAMAGFILKAITT